MEFILFIICIVCVGLCCLLLWAIRRLNLYITSLENRIEEQLNRIDDFEDMLAQSNIKNKKLVRKNIIPEEE